MKTEVIIPAAGRGARLKTKATKTLTPIGGVPLIVYSLRAFQTSSLIDGIILVVPRGEEKIFSKVVRHFTLRKVKKIIAGGKTRRESVAKGLKALDKDTIIVVIHDGARPFVTRTLIDAAVTKAKKEQSVVTAVPVTSTIKTVNSRTLTVRKTLDRKTLWEIQTPQVFKKDILLKAHRRIKDKNPSDDALLVEKLGAKVKITAGADTNIKITTPGDLLLAKIILNQHK